MHPAAKIATLKHGQRQTGQLAALSTQDQAAAMLNVGGRSVRRAREVLDEGAPELIEAVEQGTIERTRREAAPGLCLGHT